MPRTQKSRLTSYALFRRLPEIAYFPSGGASTVLHAAELTSSQVILPYRREHLNGN